MKTLDLTTKQFEDEIDYLVNVLTLDKCCGSEFTLYLLPIMHRVGEDGEIEDPIEEGAAKTGEDEDDADNEEHYMLRFTDDPSIAARIGKYFLGCVVTALGPLAEEANVTLTEGDAEYLNWEVWVQFKQTTPPT